MVWTRYGCYDTVSPAQWNGPVIHLIFVCDVVHPSDWLDKTWKYCQTPYSALGPYQAASQACPLMGFNDNVAVADVIQIKPILSDLGETNAGYIVRH